MRQPQVSYTAKDTVFTQQFSGYNHNLRSAVGQFYDMQNMTGDYYPVLSTRAQRSQLLVFTGAQASDPSPEPQAMFAKDYVYYIVRGDIVWGNTVGTEWVQAGRLSNVLTSTGKKQVADIGAYVLIMPDKKVLNTSTHTLSDAAFLFKNESWTRVVEGTSYTTTSELKFTPSTMEGDTITYTSSSTEPQDTSDYWLNTNDNKVYRYDVSTETWQQLTNVFLKVEPHLTYGAAGAGTDATEWLNSFKARINQFKAYDTINLTLDEYDASYGTLGGDTLIFYVGDGYFTIAGLQPQAFETDFKATLSIPSMAFITSLNNRIWGCSENGHEIYACKLGDPTQWYNYAGLASDSYAATIGSDGEFTGAIAYNNNVLFFKKDRLHKIYGNYPSNFQVTEYAVNGVATNCDRTLVVVNGYLFYLGEENVMIYDGSLPRSCSDAFGDLRFVSGVAGQQMNKYYLSTDDGTTVRQFVYDTETGQWWKEDDTKMKAACTYFNNLYSVHYVKDDNGVWQHVLTKEVGSYEGMLDWYVETGELGLDSPMQKYVSRVKIRMEFDGEMYVQISYNGNEFTEVFRRTSKDLKSLLIPVNVKRCDHFRLRIGGEGTAKIYSIGYNVENGSDVC